MSEGKKARKQCAKWRSTAVNEKTPIPFDNSLWTRYRMPRDPDSIRMTASGYRARVFVRVRSAAGSLYRFIFQPGGHSYEKAIRALASIVYCLRRVSYSDCTGECKWGDDSAQGAGHPAGVCKTGQAGQCT